MSKPKAIIVSGYFNPLHKGHLELFEKAKAYGDQLWVIVNSDLQRALKGSKAFMDEDERLIIVKAIGIVDKALISVDKDVIKINEGDLYGFEASLYKHWTNEFKSRRVFLSFGFILPYDVVGRTTTDVRVRLSKRIERYFQKTIETTN